VAVARGGSVELRVLRSPAAATSLYDQMTTSSRRHQGRRPRAASGFATVEVSLSDAAFRRRPPETEVAVAPRVPTKDVAPYRSRH